MLIIIIMVMMMISGYHGFFSLTVQMKSFLRSNPWNLQGCCWSKVVARFWRVITLKQRQCGSAHMLGKQTYSSATHGATPQHVWSKQICATAEMSFELIPSADTTMFLIDSKVREKKTCRRSDRKQKWYWWTCS